MEIKVKHSVHPRLGHLKDSMHVLGKLNCSNEDFICRGAFLSFTLFIFCTFDQIEI